MESLDDCEPNLQAAQRACAHYSSLSIQALATLFIAYIIASSVAIDKYDVKANYHSVKRFLLNTWCWPLSFPATSATMPRLPQVLTGYATLVSDPHFFTNDLLDQQAAEQVKSGSLTFGKLNRSRNRMETVCARVIASSVCGCTCRPA